jgi:hypothetical protein
MRILSPSTPRIVRLLLARIGLVILIFGSLLSYVIGYSSAYDNPFSVGPILVSIALSIGCLLVAALPIAMIVTNLHKPWKDGLLWAAIPLSLFWIGFATELVRYGF